MLQLYDSNPCVWAAFALARWLGFNAKYNPGFDSDTTKCMRAQGSATPESIASLFRRASNSPFGNEDVNSSALALAMQSLGDDEMRIAFFAEYMQMYHEKKTTALYLRAMSRASFIARCSEICGRYLTLDGIKVVNWIGWSVHTVAADLLNSFGPVENLPPPKGHPDYLGSDSDAMPTVRAPGEASSSADGDLRGFVVPDNVPIETESATKATVNAASPLRLVVQPLAVPMRQKRKRALEDSSAGSSYSADDSFVGYSSTSEQAEPKAKDASQAMSTCASDRFSVSDARFLGDIVECAVTLALDRYRKQAQSRKSCRKMLGVAAAQPDRQTRSKRRKCLDSQ